MGTKEHDEVQRQIVAALTASQRVSQTQREQRNMTGRSEHNRVVRQCVDELHRAGYLATATGNGAVMSAAARMAEARNGVRAGVPDVLAWVALPRQCVAVEVKTGASKLTPEQRRWLDGLAAAGWLALVVGSVDELLAAMETK